MRQEQVQCRSAGRVPEVVGLTHATARTTATIWQRVAGKPGVFEQRVDEMIGIRCDLQQLPAPGN